MDTAYRFLPPRLLAGLLLLIALVAPAAAQSTVGDDPPGRVAALSFREGGVVFAPAGDTDWLELPLNRPLTRGDRVWTDRGARAELHLGTAVLHLAGETHVAIDALDDDAAQFVLVQGALAARVRELARDERFEINTPNLALHATRAADFRVDVRADGQATRVVVRAGEVLVYGESGQSLRLLAGQQAAFGGRSLAMVADPFGGADGLDAWAAERHRYEDQSTTARYVPRAVVGYAQLDAYGSWTEDASWGAVWYPRVVPSGWAPYRYGHWTWISPWGWTWVDDAPWGFAPFHYGRWTVIGSRWAWVPGRFVARPVYAPALVVFVGGHGAHAHVQIGGSPGVAWYPLAPGEPWRPSYRVSPRYERLVNPYTHDRWHDHAHRHRADAITGVRFDDFRPGRRVHERWRAPQLSDRAELYVAPARPSQLRDEALRPRITATPPAFTPGIPESWPPGRADGRRERDASRDRDAWRERREAELQREFEARQRERHSRETDRVRREPHQALPGVRLAPPMPAPAPPQPGQAQPQVGPAPPNYAPPQPIGRVAPRQDPRAEPQRRTETPRAAPRPQDRDWGRIMSQEPLDRP